MKQKPNVLFLLADDMRFDAIAASGHPDIYTPHIDKLIQEGMSFDCAHIPGGTCGAICMPSRAMIHTGIGLFKQVDDGSVIPEEYTLLGEHLANNGYDTYGIGKWHNSTQSFNRSFQDGNEIMFGGMGDHWNVLANTYDASGAYNRLRPHIDDPFSSRETEFSLVDHISPGVHSTDLFTEDAMNYLRRDRSGNPFFLYVSYMAPHDPRSMPQKYLDMYKAADIELPLNFMVEHPYEIGVRSIRDEVLAPYPRTEQDTKQQIAEYYAMITHLDDRIGDLITQLKKSGEYKNTIIVFAGDNGLALGQHGLFGKQNLYDHSVRVPLIFSGPGIPQSSRSNALVYLMDIYPTLCELIGLSIPKSVESQSLKSIIDGHIKEVREHIYTAYKELHRAVRHDDWKLIRYHVESRVFYQLFDLSKDPWEIANLYGQSEVEDIQNELEKLIRLCANESGEMSTNWALHW